MNAKIVYIHFFNTKNPTPNAIDCHERRGVVTKIQQQNRQVAQVMVT